MRLVEEKNQFRLVRVGDFRQPLVEIGKHPQQKHRVQAGSLHKLIGGKDIDNALAVGIDADQIRQIERSEERSVGKECVSTCSSRWWPYHTKKKTTNTNNKQKRKKEQI